MDDQSEVEYSEAAQGWAEDSSAHSRYSIPQWYSLTSVARLLSVSKSTVHVWLQSGLLPFFKGPGGKQAVVRIHHDDLRAFLLRHKRLNRKG